MEKIEGVFVSIIAIGMLFIGVGLAGAVPVTSFVNLTGDVDGSGIVDAEDIRLMMIASNNHLTASECAPYGVVVDVFPDMNNDGRFGYDDIVSIQYLYSTTAPGTITAVEPCPICPVCPGDIVHDYIVGDVDGDGDFDRWDLRQLVRGFTWIWEYKQLIRSI